MKLTKVSVLLLSFLLGQSVEGQNAMNLKQCMEYALEHSSEMLHKRSDYDDALVERRDAILRAFTPMVSAGTNVYMNFGRAVDPETNSYISSTSFSNGYSVSAGMTLFDGFSALNNVKIAKTAVKMGLSSQQKLEDEICLSVMEAYFNVVFHTEMMEVVRLQVETARQNLTLVTKKYEMGQKGYPDVVQTDADLAEKEYDLVQRTNQREEALLNLKALMLWPVKDTLLLSNPVDDEGELSAPSFIYHNLDIASYAKEHQPAAHLAKLSMDQAKYALRAAKGQFYPSLSLHGGWSTSYYTYPGKHDYKAPSFTSQFHNNGGEYFQVSLSIPLFDRLSRFSNLRKKKNAYQRAAATYRQTLHDIEAEVERATQESNGAYKSFIQAKKRMRVQEESYRLSEKKMLQGLMSPIEYQTVSNAYLNAKAEYLNSILRYKLKESVVNFYSGISYLEQQK